MDYTPTTEEMRQAWAGQLVQSATPNCFELIDEGQASDEFDRWLVARDREVAARAWDEGAQHVYAEGKCLFAQDGDPCPANPYREPNA